ncbi:MAG: hypothetical protein ACTSRL_11405 [Candidatus Helarchaeota archaeon]
MTVSMADPSALSTMLTMVILYCILSVTVFLVMVHLCVFFNDLCYYLYRKWTHTVCRPPEMQLPTRRQFGGLGLLIIVLMIGVAVIGILLNVQKPTPVQVTQRSDQILVSGVDKTQIQVKSFQIIVGSLTPGEFQEFLQTSQCGEEEIFAGIIYTIPLPIWGSGGLPVYNLDYHFTLPKEDHPYIMACVLEVFIDIGTAHASFTEYYFPTENYQCSNLRKHISLTAIQVMVNETGIIQGMTFEVSLSNQFHLEDLLQFGW